MMLLSMKVIQSEADVLINSAYLRANAAAMCTNESRELLNSLSARTRDTDAWTLRRSFFRSRYSRGKID